MKRILEVLLVLAFGATAHAATLGREELREGEKVLVLENDVAKIVVWPEAGGAIVDYLDKRSGVDFATKGVRKGKTGYGLKETTALRVYDPVEQFGSLPYQAELVKGAGYAAIVASCTSGYLRVEREMRLADDSTALTVIDRHVNISDKPKTIWLRWHPYLSLDDGTPAAAALLLPGPTPQSMRRKAFSSIQDAHFMDIPGYWMAVNSSGLGLWMTFVPDQIMVGAAWNDAAGGGKGRKPTNPGNFAPEVYPFPQIVAPGKSVEVRCAYQPFTAGDRSGAMGMELVPAGERVAARRFLDLTRANLNVLVPYTMGSFGNYMHRRRDRFALLDWGIMDAMMAVPADQDKPIRTRLFAQAFDGYGKPFTASFKLTITDPLGKTVKEQIWKYEGTPETRVIDKREDLSIADLPDGRYTFKLEAFEGTNTQSVHQFLDMCKVAGAQRVAACAARVKAEQGVPLEKRERPFVKALRTIAVPDVKLGVVPIGVEEASGLARSDWPVRVGVPFAQGLLAKGAPVAMSAPDGKAVPVQSTVMGTWMDGSVKWLLVDFPASVPANSSVFYTLKANVKPAAAPAANVAAQEGGAIRIDTGANKWAFSAADAKLLGLFGADDIWWKTADGRNYRFELKGDEAGISVVENGPQRAVVKVVGWYVPVSPTAGDSIARGEFRAEFCRGQSWFRLYHTFTFAGDPWKDALASTGVRFSGLLAGATEAGIDLDGKTVMQPKSISLWQADDDHAVVEQGATPVQTGRRSTGAAVLKGAAGRAVVYHRHLWEMFPKAVSVEAAAGAIAFEYWPRRAGAMDWRPREDGWHSSSPAPQALGVGASRTHEFIVDGTSSLDASQYQAAFDEPVIAVVAPRYLCATKALEELQPYDPGTIPGLENHVNEAFDSYILNQSVYGWYGEWQFGTIPNWFFPETMRWAYFGRYGNLLNELDICHGPWLAYLRSGDRKYLKFAEANTKHLMDVGTIRLSPLYPESIGLSRRHHECIWLGPGDYGHSMLDPFLELYHATGYRPGFEAAERMARGMASTRSGENRYLVNPIGGMARMYLETQDPFYKREADRLWIDRCFPNRNGWCGGDHASRMTMYYTQINGDCKRLERELVGWKVKIGTWTGLDYDEMARVYAETGDKRYAQQALASFSAPDGTMSLTPILQGNDPKRADPLRWSIAMQPQIVLSALRPLLYASGMLEDALNEKAAGGRSASNAPPVLVAEADDFDDGHADCNALPEDEFLAYFFADSTDF